MMPEVDDTGCDTQIWPSLQTPLMSLTNGSHIHSPSQGVPSSPSLLDSPGLLKSKGAWKAPANADVHGKRTYGERESVAIDWRTPLKRKASAEEARAESIHREKEIRSSDTNEAEEQLTEVEMPDGQNMTELRITTGVSFIDDRFGLEADKGRVLTEHIPESGLSCGALLEITGTSGSGKTTLVMQMAIRERLAYLRAPGSTEWDEKKAHAPQIVMIDTEGGMSVRRMLSMAAQEVDEELIRSTDGTMARGELIQTVLQGIHLSRCTSIYEFLAALEALVPPPLTGKDAAQSSCVRGKMSVMDTEYLLRSKRLPPRTRTLMIDSISYFFRAPVVDTSSARMERQRQLSSIRAFVTRARQIHGLRIVTTNQMALTFVSANGERGRPTDEGSSCQLWPSLRGWAPDSIVAEHAWQLLLFRSGDRGDRFAQIVARPASLRTAWSDEKYWHTWIPYTFQSPGSNMRQCSVSLSAFPPGSPLQNTAPSSDRL